MLLRPHPRGAFEPDKEEKVAFPEFNNERHLSMVFEENRGHADMIEKVRMMLYGYAYGSLDTSSDREELHAVCACPCPQPLFVNYFINRYAEERKRWRDRNGRFPLHLAVESGKLDVELL